MEEGPLLSAGIRNDCLQNDVTAALQTLFLQGQASPGLQEDKGKEGGCPVTLRLKPRTLTS